MPHGETMTNEMNGPTDEEIRASVEKTIFETFHQQSVIYREFILEVVGTAEIETDDWGVHVRIITEGDFENFSLSGAWSILHLSEDRLFAAYVGWSIEKL